MWTFPRLPEEPVQPEIPFELRYPISPNSVGAQCGENFVNVEVMEDFFGTGKRLMASAFALGGCGPTGQDDNARVLIFESELHGCGSMLTVTEDELVYTFTLVYSPQEVSNGVPLVRSSDAEVSIGCHYPRDQTKAETFQEFGEDDGFILSEDRDLHHNSIYMDPSELKPGENVSSDSYLHIPHKTHKPNLDKDKQ